LSSAVGAQCGVIESAALASILVPNRQGLGRHAP